jgi:hypothetical protein
MRRFLQAGVTVAAGTVAGVPILITMSIYAGLTSVYG